VDKGKREELGAASTNVGWGLPPSGCKKEGEKDIGGKKRIARKHIARRFRQLTQNEGKRGKRENVRRGSLSKKKEKRGRTAASR